jgi:ADP-heptose:LPS heptosyltransferase
VSQRFINAVAGAGRYSVVIRFSALGDVLLTLPVLGPLAEATSSRIVFVTREPYENLIKRHPDVAAVYTIPPRGAGGRPEVKTVCGRINADFGGKMPLAVDLHRVPLSRYALSLVRAEEKVTYRKYGFKRSLLCVLGVDLLPRPTKRVPDLYAETLKRWGVAGPNYGFGLSVDGTRGAVLREEFGLADGYAAIFPGAVYPTKAWPEEKYAELARFLTKAGIPAAVMGAPAERELCYRVADGAGVPNLAGEIALDDLPEVLSAARVIVGNDSAPVHFASVIGVPAVAIIGPTSPRFGFAPWGKRSGTLYAGVGCSPCSRHGRSRCWRRRRYCFDEVSVGDVFAAVAEAGER